MPRRHITKAFCIATALIVPVVAAIGPAPATGAASSAPSSIATATRSAEPGDRAAGDEGADVAVPATDAAAQLAAAGQPTGVGSATTGPIEDFDYDKLRTKGRASRVCHGRLRTGTAWTYNEIVRRFGGFAGTLYSCRERWAVFEDPECNGESADPVTNPRFYSDCWSNHAQGRALDVMVGSSGGVNNKWRGDAIVNWLLATDGDGNVNAMARRLGVQQFLWNDKCWNSDGDRGVATADDMRTCGYGHFDHVHIDLSLAGASGETTYWGAPAAPPAPKINSVLARDADGHGGWIVRRWDNLRIARSGAGSWPKRWTVLPGDFDGDGRQDDTLLWDRTTGRWKVLAWTRGAAEVKTNGTWSATFDSLAVGDLDADGLLDDLVAWDRSTGAWTATAFFGFAATTQRSGQWPTGYDVIAVGDWNSNGTRDDSMLWDRETGNWRTYRWAGLGATHTRSGRFGTGPDALISGDLDAQGSYDEMFLWDADTGRYFIYTWRSGYRIVYKGADNWSLRWDRFVTGDYDTDGRVDDMFLVDRRTGRWRIISWHRFEARMVRRGDWPTVFDSFVSGTLS